MKMFDFDIRIYEDDGNLWINNLNNLNNLKNDFREDDTQTAQFLKSLITKCLNDEGLTVKVTLNQYNKDEYTPPHRH